MYRPDKDAPQGTDKVQFTPPTGTRSADAFGLLMEQVIAGNGLEGIARLLSDMLGLPASVADDELEPLHAYAPRGRKLEIDEATLETTVREQIRFSDGQLAQASTVPPTLHLTDSAGEAYTIAPIVVASGIDGYIWVSDPSGHSSWRARQVVSWAAAACVVEMVRQRAIMEGESRVRNSFLEDVLTGPITSASATRRRARYLGYDLNGEHVVVILDLDLFREYVRRHDHDERSIQRLKDRFRRALEGSLPALWGRPLVWEHSDSLVMLVPAGEDFDPHIFRERVETVRSKVERRLAGPGVSAGIGRPYADLSRLQVSYKEADHALRVGAAVSGRSATSAFSEMGPYRLLFHLRDQPELRQFCEEALGALQRYDQERGAALVETLATYLEQQGNLSQTARALHLHRNGLLYRLSRIEEIASCDLSDPQQRLTFQLALLIRPLIPTRKRSHGSTSKSGRPTGDPTAP